MNSFDVFQKVLRILFYVCVVLTLVCYAAQRWFDLPNPYWMYCGVGAVGCSLVRFFLRFM